MILSYARWSIMGLGYLRPYSTLCSILLKIFRLCLTICNKKNTKYVGFIFCVLYYIWDTPKETSQSHFLKRFPRLPCLNIWKTIHLSGQGKYWCTRLKMSTKRCIGTNQGIVLSRTLYLGWSWRISIVNFFTNGVHQYFLAHSGRSFPRSIDKVKERLY